MSIPLYDAHNHLQDERFGGRQSELLAAWLESGGVRMVVNGSSEADWRQVLDLARAQRQVVPSFGYHPWYVQQRSGQWLANLRQYLDQIPSAVGEIGLDRWKPGLPYDAQEDVFLAQLRLAAERNRPVSIHCLRAWGRLFELLQDNPRPACGFLLHSYGGSAEMVSGFARLGAYFSLPGFFARARKIRQQEAFKLVPPDRLLIETDAPDQMLPEPAEADARLQNIMQHHQAYPLSDPASGKLINHPANLELVYLFAAELRGEPVQRLAQQVETNFHRLFGGIVNDLSRDH